ncbi:hypothetical protein VUR80DRAFT_9347 [Thermomyces stellatus]
MGLTGNAPAFQTGGSQFLGVGQSLYQDPEHADPLPSQVYYQDPPMGLDVTSVPFPDLNMHVDPTHMQFNPDTSLTATSSPQSPWTASFTPPQSPPDADEAWYQPSLGSSPESPPSDYGVPQPYMGQDMGLTGLAGGDLSAVSMTRENSYTVPQTSRRSRSEGETARDHALYKNATPQADGLYHCPWEGTPECHHKPEKLKCNYDKFVDSHLRPYRCKVESCADARFSSTACLLRHEREAHRMHGHQAYNCTYKGCERSQEGKGFPRAWNLKDHMRRVHNDHGNGAIQGQSEDQQSKGRRKSKGSTAGSRKSSKSMPVADSNAKDRMTQDYMEWDNNYLSLQGVVQQLGKPTDPESRRQLKKAQKFLEQMSEVYQRVNAGSAASRRQSGD